MLGSDTLRFSGTPHGFLVKCLMEGAPRLILSNRCLISFRGGTVNGSGEQMFALATSLATLGSKTNLKASRGHCRG